MPDHIFTASVKSRLADTRASKRKADDAYANLKDKTTAYAHEIARLAALHRQVEAIWLKALEEAHDEN